MSIAHDRSAGIESEPFQLLAEGLHHDFLCIADSVDDQSKLAILRLEHNHVHRLIFRTRTETENLVQVCNRKESSAPPIDRSAMHTLNVFF